MADHRRRAREYVARWWRGRAGASGRVLDALLAPAEFGYRAAVRAREAGYGAGLLRSERADVPVVSVGNITVGGTGKTPVARWLATELKRRGERPGILHGGYAPDEPALHRAWHPDLPVVATRDRVEGARRAVARGATVLVLDDGFQHRRLARDLDIALVAAEQSTARPRLLPRGPWREPPRALSRADVVAVTRKTARRADAERVAAEVAGVAPDAAIAGIRLEPGAWTPHAAAGGATGPRGETVAVAGIGRPEAFFTHVRDRAGPPAATLTFPDHHAYQPRDVDRIRRTAAGRPVITTAKDAIKLASLAPGLELWVLEQEVVIECGANALAARLDELTAATDPDGTP